MSTQHGGMPMFPRPHPHPGRAWCNLWTPCSPACGTLGRVISRDNAIVHPREQMRDCATPHGRTQRRDARPRPGGHVIRVCGLVSRVWDGA
eukprot:3680501-Prymnesium_polylepis.1